MKKYNTILKLVNSGWRYILAWDSEENHFDVIKWRPDCAYSNKYRIFTKSHLHLGINSQPSYGFRARPNGSYTFYAAKEIE